MHASIAFDSEHIASWLKLRKEPVGMAELDIKIKLSFMYQPYTE